VDAAAAGARGRGPGPGDAFSDIFGDVFGDIFGGGRRNRSGVFRGADLRYELPLDLEQAVFGATVNITIPTLVACETCKGSGARPGTGTTQCRRCGGAGQVRISQGFFSVQQTCPTCHGTGQVIEQPCMSCQGRGRVQQSKTLAVKVPAGVDDGDRIRLSGEGEPGQNGGPPGDLYVELRVRPHPIFERQGADLSCVVPVNFATAALGGSVEVPTLDGEVTLKIPPETQPGKVLRLRGKGVRPVRSNSVGDMYCRIDVEVPVNLTAEQKKLLKSFNDALAEGGDRHRPRSHSWKEGVRRFFEKLGS
jgi:molecular chaperone DnaJ